MWSHKILATVATFSKNYIKRYNHNIIVVKTLSERHHKVAEALDLESKNFILELKFVV